jgi:hypothetical protein
VILQKITSIFLAVVLVTGAITLGVSAFIDDASASGDKYRKDNHDRDRGYDSYYKENKNKKHESYKIDFPKDKKFVIVLNNTIVNNFDPTIDSDKKDKRDNKDKKYDSSYGSTDYGMDDNSYGYSDYRDDRDKKYDSSYGMDDNSYGYSDYRDDKDKKYDSSYGMDDNSYGYSDYQIDMDNKSYESDSYESPYP